MRISKTFFIPLLVLSSSVSYASEPTKEELIKLKEGYISNMKAGCFHAYRNNKELEHLSDEYLTKYCNCVGEALKKEVTLEEMKYFSVHKKPGETQKQKLINATQACNK